MLSPAVILMGGVGGQTLFFCQDLDCGSCSIFCWSEMKTSGGFCEVAWAFSAGDTLVGSGFTSVNVVELTCYCCFVNRWYPDTGWIPHPWFLGWESWLLAFSDSLAIVGHLMLSASGERRAATIRNIGMWPLVLINFLMVKLSCN